MKALVKLATKLEPELRDTDVRGAVQCCAVLAA
jgi:hypothetical protein